MFAKQAVKLLNNGKNEANNSTWKSLVNIKYNTRLPKSSRKESYSWKCLQNTISGSFVRPQWTIGKGQLVRIWWDRWILDEPLGRYPLAINMDKFGNQTVDTLLNDDRTWNMDKVKEVLPDVAIERIAGVRRTEKDSKGSAFVVGGKFSVALACAENSKNAGGNNISLSTPGRYMATKRVWWFTWKLIRNKLPTRENLERRKIIVDNSCPMCGNHLETNEHWLIECHRSSQFWNKLKHTMRWDINKSDLETIKRRLGKKGKLDIWNASSQAITAIGAWNLWKLRNEAVFISAPEGTTKQLTIKDAVRRCFASFTSCFALNCFASLEHDRRYDEWLRSIGILGVGL